MEIIQKFTTFKNEIDHLFNLIEKKREERETWSNENRKQIKALYPAKNKIYKVKDIYKIVNSYDHDKINSDEDYYFKVTFTRFAPKTDFRFDDPYPSVKGVVLDCNLKETDLIGYFTRVSITELEKVEKKNTSQSERLTKIYVMIDKNTGYYKIGRSKNPSIRERTLQSEKPTIEMLFNSDAKVKDEKVLHDKFYEKRVRGEWFDLNGSDLCTIKQYLNC